MKQSSAGLRAKVGMLSDIIANSPIVVRQPVICSVARLPVGFDAFDAAILDWIVAESQRLRAAGYRL
jgi:hypothetical protein